VRAPDLTQGWVLELVHRYPTAARLATAAILADALEEAGCTNQDLLSHLRGPGASGTRNLRLFKD
jgi:hypothetical protein